jgi:hypothetical protein
MCGEPLYCTKNTALRLFHQTCNFVQYLETICRYQDMDGSQKVNQKRPKPLLAVPLQIQSPVSTPTLNHRSVELPVARLKRNLSTDPQAADYVKENPTPAEVYAKQNFAGLCLECQMIFATWKHPDGIGIPSHERNHAHHSFKVLEHCWCPLCKMLLRSLYRYDEEVLQTFRLHANYTANSHVKIYIHDRYTPCYYVELVYDFNDRRLKPYFMMFAAGETQLTIHYIRLLINYRSNQQFFTGHIAFLYKL